MEDRRTRHVGARAMAGRHVGGARRKKTGALGFPGSLKEAGNKICCFLLNPSQVSYRVFIYPPLIIKIGK
jgi:hypothetical protein